MSERGARARESTDTVVWIGAANVVAICSGQQVRRPGRQLCQAPIALVCIQSARQGRRMLRVRKTEFTVIAFGFRHADFPALIIEHYESRAKVVRRSDSAVRRRTIATAPFVGLLGPFVDWHDESPDGARRSPRGSVN